nr:hypothetical protein Iba_chr14aCG10640 [Ipomoea batatas]
MGGLRVQVEASMCEVRHPSWDRAQEGKSVTISPSPVTQGPAASTAAYPVATASSTAPPHLRRSPVTTPLLQSLPPNLQSSIRPSSPPATTSKALAASTVVSAVAIASSTTAPPVTAASSTTASPVDGHNYRLAGIGRYKVNKWRYEKKSNKKYKQVALRWKHVDIDVECPTYGLDAKTLEHIFLCCVVAGSVWNMGGVSHYFTAGGTFNEVC